MQAHKTLGKYTVPGLGADVNVFRPSPFFATESETCEVTHNQNTIEPLHASAQEGVQQWFICFVQ